MINDLLPAIIGQNRVVACPHPFSTRAVDLWAPYGRTVAEIVRDAGVQHGRSVVQVNDWPIPAEWHDRYVPPPGSLVVIRAVPSGENPLRSILLLVVAVVATFAAWWTYGATAPAAGVAWAAFFAALAATAVSAIGMLAVNAIAPLKTPDMATLNLPMLLSIGATTQPHRTSSSALDRSPSISRARNSSNPYGPIPRPLGRHKIVPPFGAEPYTEISGDDQYLRLLFVLGYGPLDVSDLKIGDTDLADFSGVEYEVKEGYGADTPLTLFTNDIEETALNIQLTSAGGYYQRTTSLETNEISIDITFPRGLLEFKETYEEGEDPEASVTVEVEYGYSLAGAGSWTTGTISTTGKRGGTIRKNVRVAVAEGQYDVRLKRTTADTDIIRIADEVWWTALRSIHSEHPINMDGLALVALRIKASDQLNGVVDTFNCVVHSVLLDWNGAAWVEQAANNPASLFREVLQGAANKRALSDSEIDLDGLEDWHEFCAAQGFTYNQVIDFRSSVEDTLREIAAAGRAAPAYIDGKYGVVWDRAQTTPRQHFSPRNSWGFSSKKFFFPMPHAFRVRFPNAAKGWTEDERIVYDDGYAAANATMFEQLTLPGVTSSDLAWKHGRYHIACARLRPEQYSFYADMEHIVVTRGDLIRMAHDVPEWGVGWGRVKSLTDNGTHITIVTMDEALAMEAGKSYCVRFRKADGSTLLCNVVTSAGEQTALTLMAPALMADGPAVGDMGLFGEVGSESVELVIRSIEPLSDLTARITAVDAAPPVYTADSGAIPEFNSQLTLPYDMVKTIGAPVVSSIKSDESVLVRDTDGVFHVRIVVGFQYRAGRLYDQITETQAEYRLTGYDGPWERITFLNYVPEISLLNIAEGATYDLRFRYRLADGRVSAWTGISAHTVIGKTTPPPDVETLWVEGNVLRWTYPTLPLDFLGFRVRHRAGTGTSWADATPACDDLIKGTVFSLDALPKGTRTILVKAEDVAGNRSLNAAVLVKDLGDPDIANVVLATDYAATGFPGTITNGTVDGTDLEANTSTPFWPVGDSVVFWKDDEAAAFWDAVYLEMTYIAEFLPETESLPGEISLDYNIAGSPYEALYRSAGDSWFWETPDTLAFWGDDADTFWSAQGAFATWPGKLDAVRQKYEFKVVCGAGTVQGIIYDFAAFLDVPDIEEEFEDVAIGASGTRLTLAEVYRAIANVQVTVQDDGGSGIYAKIMDKNTGGPLIQVFNVSGSGVSGTIDALVKGY